MLFHRVRASFTPPTGTSAIVRAPNTGWKPIHTLETGVRLRHVAAFIPIKGIRVPAGETHSFELTIEADLELPVGTCWSVDIGRVECGQRILARFEITEVLEVSSQPIWHEAGDDTVGWFVYS